jgi:hypothetical protein
VVGHITARSRNSSANGSGKRAGPRQKSGRRRPGYLTANKGEAAAELKQQIAKVDEKASLQFSLHPVVTAAGFETTQGLKSRPIDASFVGATLHRTDSDDF